MARTRKNQGGLSSVEMVLIIPFLLTIILLLANTGKFWHAKLDNRIDARTSAWRGAKLGTVPCGEDITGLSDKLGSVPGAGTVIGGIAVGSYADVLGNACADYSNGNDLLETMVSGSNKWRDHKDAFVATFNGSPVPVASYTGYAYDNWSSWGFRDQSVFEMSDTHHLDINGLWERSDMPYGHDDYIQEKLIK